MSLTCEGYKLFPAKIEKVKNLYERCKCGENNFIGDNQG